MNCILLHEWAVVGKQYTRTVGETRYAYITETGVDRMCAWCGRMSFAFAGRDWGPPLESYRLKDE